MTNICMMNFLSALFYLEIKYPYISVYLPSKHLTYPIILGSFIHSGLITSSSLYPMKYVIDLFVPYGSFF